MWSYVLTGVVAVQCLVVIKLYLRINLRTHEMRDCIRDIEGRTQHYRERYVIPQNEFLYTWTRQSGGVDDFDIVTWCSDARVKKGGVKFKYHWSNEGYHGNSNAITVWIRDPKLAMEFKLKWH